MSNTPLNKTPEAIKVGSRVKVLPHTRWLYDVKLGDYQQDFDGGEAGKVTIIYNDGTAEVLLDEKFVEDHKTDYIRLENLEVIDE